MNINSLARAACFLTMVSLFFLSVPVAQGHPCDRDPSPGHKHCSPDPAPPDRIAGCATFAAGPIEADGTDTYCDGDGSTNYQNAPQSMQVAMNCSSNWFNLAPGGGEKRVRLNLSSAPIVTGISSCEGVTTPIYLSDTGDAAMDLINCTNTDPDWAFLQHMRAPASNGNVCQLRTGDQPLQATMRFQSHLYHLKTCKGGAKKCGTFTEELEVNYDGDSCSDDVTISCTAESGAQCTTWTVASDGPGCLSHSSGVAPTSATLPFAITFQAN